MFSFFMYLGVFYSSGDAFPESGMCQVEPGFERGMELLYMNCILCYADFCGALFICP